MMEPLGPILINTKFIKHKQMKKIYISILILFVGMYSLTAQVGIGTTDPNANAVLDIVSTTQGVAFPRMSTALRTGIALPAQGLLVFDTDLDCLMVNVAAGTHSWECLGSAPPPTNPVGSGTLGGKTCFDVAELNDGGADGDLATRTTSKADFTQAATHTQTYTFTPSGTVSNVRFVYVNTNGSAVIAISGDNTGNNISSPVLATVNLDTSLNTTATGVTAVNALTADIYVVYNNGTTNNGIDVQLKITLNVKDSQCCGAFVAAGVWKKFLCHNLGADDTLDPNLPVQGIHGDYYQWGRPTSVATAYDSAAAITGWNTTLAANGAWQGATKTAADPCPAGYRVPTNVQWTGVGDAALNTESITGAFAGDATGFGSAKHFGPNVTTKTLTLPAAGYRDSSTGLLSTRDTNGWYWSSEEAGDAGNNSAKIFYFSDTNASTGLNRFRTYGFSIRCIEE